MDKNLTNNEKEEYLAEDFDPNTLRVPELRNILVKHGINYNSSAKKDELIDVFQENIKNAKIQSLINQEKDETYPISPISPQHKIKEKSLKRKSKADTEDLENKENDSKRKLPKEFNEDTKPLLETDPSDKKRKNSTNSTNAPLTPTRKTTTKRDKSIFSDENPFQSGPESIKKRSQPESTENTESSNVITKKKHKHSVDIGASSTISVPDLPDIQTELKTRTSSQNFNKSSPVEQKFLQKANIPPHPHQSPKQTTRLESFPEYPQSQRPGGLSSGAKPKITDLVSYYEDPDLSLDPNYRHRPLLNTDVNSQAGRNSLNAPLSSYGVGSPFGSSQGSKRYSIQDELLQYNGFPRIPSYDGSPERRYTERRISGVDEKHIIDAHRQFKETLERREQASTRASIDSHRRLNSAMSEKAAIHRFIGSDVGTKRSITEFSNKSFGFTADTRPQRSILSTVFVRFILYFVPLLISTAVIWRQLAFLDAGYLQTRDNIPKRIPEVPSLPLKSDNFLEKLNKYTLHAYSLYVEPIGMNCPPHATCLMGIPFPKTYNAANNPRDSIRVDFGTSESKKTIFQCDSGYIVHYPLKSILGMIIVPPVCIADKDTGSRISDISHDIAAMLEDYRGSSECTHSTDQQLIKLFEKFKTLSKETAFVKPSPLDWSLIKNPSYGELEDPDQITEVGLQDVEIKKRIKPQYPMPDTEFEYLFSQAISLLSSEKSFGVQLINLESESENNSDMELWLVGLSSKYPTFCRSRLILLFLFTHYLFWILEGLFLLLILYLAFRRVSFYYQEKKSAKRVTEAIYKLLELVSKYHYLDPVMAPYSNILVDQIFDYLLFDTLSDNKLYTSPLKPKSYNLEFLSEILSIENEPDLTLTPVVRFYDPRTRATVWKRVVSMVEKSENVKTNTHQLGTSNSYIKSWEWVGPLTLERKE
ncbi:hypothetical protein BB559_000784 [Furculomyces boomerangus]|uniref:Man1/Src1 C-terminal domain-containing protein n=1 Tax=Furculomyces boomerangus TaxID=61424 RepID=A0A2T9Z497_9FUNG|nr:hypothetical protein BB559_000784 [Furculomyces boomerangus]